VLGGKGLRGAEAGRGGTFVICGRANMAVDAGDEKVGCVIWEEEAKKFVGDAVCPLSVGDTPCD